MNGRINCLLVLMIMVVAGFVTACASSRTASLPADPQVYMDEHGRLVYRGPITADANAEAKAMYDSSEGKPDTLLIASAGGRIDASLDLAEWLHDRGLAVEVGEVCFSSCANYILPAGRIKKLNAESIVGWHGSAWQPSFDRFVDPGDPDFDPVFVELREREVCFFERIRVDNLMPVYGLEQLGMRDWMRARFGGGSLLGFDYDLADLERLGVSNVMLVDDEWEWREHRRDIARRVSRVSLDEDYQFTANRFGTCDAG